MKPRRSPYLLLGALALAGALAWGWIYAHRSRWAPPENPSASKAVESAPEGARAAVAPEISSSQAPSAAQSVIVPAPGDFAPQTAPVIKLETGMLPWEQVIAGIIGSLQLDEAAKAKALLRALPSLPEEALETAAQTAVERLPNADYAAVAQPVLLNPETHTRTLSVLFADLMERPPAIALPALLAIARLPAHPYAPFAVDNLRLLTGTDAGGDWTRWEAVVRQRLAAAEPGR